MIRAFLWLKQQSVGVQRVASPKVRRTSIVLSVADSERRAMQSDLSAHRKSFHYYEDLLT